MLDESMNNNAYGENELFGNDLSGVTFVRDYIQLQFNPPPTINILTKVTVISGDAVINQGELGFANALIGQINKTVLKILAYPESYFAIVFNDQSIIKISLEDKDRTGPELINIFLRNDKFIVL